MKLSLSFLCDTANSREGYHCMPHWLLFWLPMSTFVVFQSETTTPSSKSLEVFFFFFLVKSFYFTYTSIKYHIYITYKNRLSYKHHQPTGQYIDIVLISVIGNCPSLLPLVALFLTAMYLSISYLSFPLT